MSARRASLGTIFLTVFLDLLGFGLVIPYLPSVARGLGATDAVATLLGAAYSLMQFVFVPLWGQTSDKTGRRPVLVASIAASAVGYLILARADSLALLFVARLWSGIATSNIAVAQAYIADVTAPEERAKGMGLIGAGIGLGFVLGPGIGGALESVSPLARQGALPAYAGFGLSILNLVLAFFTLPESLPADQRGKRVRRASPIDPERYREAIAIPGVGVAIALNFVLVISFAALEQIFPLFTADEFGMKTAGTATVLVLVGVVLITVQGGLMRPLSKRAAERTLIKIGIAVQILGFAGLALSPRAGVPALYVATGVVAFGSALVNPSLSAYVSRCSGPQNQGAVLGVLQSAGAFARVCGPATVGVIYQSFGHAAPYALSAVGMTVALVLALRLKPRASGPSAEVTAGAARQEAKAAHNP